MVTAFFGSNRERMDSNAIRRDYGEYSGLTVNSEQVSGIDLDALFDQNPMWAQARDSTEVPEESLSATRALIKEIWCALPVSEKGYVDLVQQLAGEVKDMRQKSEGDKR